LHWRFFWASRQESSPLEADLPLADLKKTFVFFPGARAELLSTVEAG